jgi:CDGSH-type Zn-finger protein
VALCRCGASAIKPYCDGTHKMIKFRTEPPTEAGQEP